MTSKMNKFALAFSTMLVGGGALAATGTGTLTATATVLASCTITGAMLTFSVYDPASAVDHDAQTTVAVVCTIGSTYSTTALASRFMITGAGGAGQQLTFGVYGSTSDRTSGTQLPLTNTTGKIAGTGTGLPQNINLFGRVATLQNVVAGAYTNTLTPTNLTIER